MMTTVESESVKKVRAALNAAGHEDAVIELEATVRGAEDAARALGTEPGAIVASLVFMVGKQPVLALIAGDRRCKVEALPRALNLTGAVRRCDAGETRAATGFAIGGVPPVGLAQKLPITLDASLKRFGRLYAAAGHLNCVFATTVEGLKRLTGGIVSYNIAEPA